MEMATIIGSTYKRHINVCISDIYCCFTLIHVSSDSLNTAICKVLFENSKKNGESYPHIKDNVSFHGELEKMNAIS